MKGAVIKVFIILVIFMLASEIYVVHGQADESDVYSQAKEASGANDLENEYSEEVKQFLEEHNISLDNPYGLTSLDIKSVIGSLFEKVKERAQAPLRMFLAMLSVVILSSLVENLGDTAKKESIVKVFCIISVLVSVLILTDPVCDCINQASEAMSEGATFMLGFIPVFASITAGGGSIASAGAYNVIVVFAAEIMVQIASGVLMPLLSMTAALSIVDSINPGISLSGMIEGIKKLVTWGLGLMMTIFVGMLSIQSIIGNSADTLSVKTAKFMVANLIPVVGGAVSDAYTTLKGSLGMLKSGVGGIGIIVIIMTVMPTVINLVLYRLAISGAGMIAEITGANSLMKLFKNMSAVMGIAFSILVSFSLMFIISTAIIMSLVQ